MSAILAPTAPDLPTELAQWAASRYAALTVGETCFANHRPEDRDQLSGVSVFFLGTGGPANREDNAWSEYTVQIKVVADNLQGYQEARNLAWAIHDDLHGSMRATTPSYFIHLSRHLQPPYPLGRDERGRETFVFNMLFITRPL